MLTVLQKYNHKDKLDKGVIVVGVDPADKLILNRKQSQTENTRCSACTYAKWTGKICGKNNVAGQRNLQKDNPAFPAIGLLVSVYTRFVDTTMMERRQGFRTKEHLEREIAELEATIELFYPKSFD